MNEKINSPQRTKTVLLIIQATGTLTITVTNVNDNAPTCSPGVYVTNIAEQTAAGT